MFVRGPDGRLWYAPGTWYDASGARQTEPPALALARVEGTLVVNAGGANEATGPILKRAPPASTAPAPGLANPR